MMKLAIIITTPPYGDMRSVEALSYANAALEIETKVDIILVDGGVLLAMKGQSSDMSEYKEPYEALKDVVHLGGNIIADKGSLKEFDLDASDLIDDVQILNGYEISLQAKEADKTMIF
jgi:sulfur relay (sulfurtransferase) DsrF/TusC family protein